MNIEMFCKCIFKKSFSGLCMHLTMMLIVNRTVMLLLLNSFENELGPSYFTYRFNAYNHVATS